MARSRRPELEKDNPTAPQLYIGPRRRSALSRRAAASQTSAPNGMAAAMHTLISAAEEFVNGVPYVQELDKERNALLDAITQAQTLLSAEHAQVKQAVRRSKDRNP
ncbi:MAG: hypothetical protein JNM35_07270 [Nitrospira sp.]|nr:hypothetical protein [Nitrospira sp.]